MTATLEDIAQRSGVSVSTVSRVLNNVADQSRISSRTQQLVLRAAKELRYRPNQLARGLRLKKTSTIGLIVPDISNPFFAYVTRSIQREAHCHGYSLVVCDTDENLDLEIEHVNLLVDKGVDGLIVLPVGQKSEHLLRLRKEKIPFVLVDRHFDDLAASSVLVDNYRGAFEVVEHLIQMGHSRIGIIQGLPGTYTSKGRLKGYQDALKANGITFENELIVGSSFREETGYAGMKYLMNLSNPPTAVFATGDLLALGALKAIEEERWRIPEDVSLVAFDEIDFNPYLKCPLTTVAQPKESMGELAVKLLLDDIKIKGKKETKQIVLNPRLILGRSVKPLKNPLI
jgi:LacI family transcriptional regulator